MAGVHEIWIEYEDVLCYKIRHFPSLVEIKEILRCTGVQVDQVRYPRVINLY